LLAAIGNTTKRARPIDASHWPADFASSNKVVDATAAILPRAVFESKDVSKRFFSLCKVQRNHLTTCVQSFWRPP